MSINSLLQPYLPLSEKQIVPEYVKYHNPTRQSVIIDRTTTSFPPTSGSSYTVGSNSGQSNQISWLISDASRFLDLPTASLNFDYTLTNSNAGATGSNAQALPVDNGVSLFARCQIKLGGILLEDILQLNTNFNSKMVTNMNKDFYENNMNVLCGSWVHNNGVYGGANCVQADVATRFTNALLSDYNSKPSTANLGPATVTRSFTIPLSFISGLFSVQKLMPLPMMNTLEINLYFDTLANSHYSNTASANTAVLPNLYYQLSNVRIVTDMVEMNSQYCQLIKQIAYNDEAGLNIAYDTTQSFGLNYTSSTSSAQELSLSFNKASPFVRGVLCSKTNPLYNNNLNWLNPLNFINNGNGGVRLSVGSIYNPVFGDTANNALTYAVMRTGDINNVVSGGIQNAPVYSGRILPTSGAAVTTGAGGSLDSQLTAFTFGFNFDKVLASLVDKDGLDTGALGSAIQIYLKENTNANTPSTVNGTMVLNVFIAYTRHLSMKGGVLSVSG
jgi:hypothetical protein